VEGLVTVVLGNAHEKVKQLKDPIGLLFLDADKEGYERTCGHYCRRCASAD
jgi:predicted O-methyltransferase YrrM